MVRERLQITQLIDHLDLMNFIKNVTILVLLSILVISCRDKREDVPTIAPRATVPASPTDIPIPPTSTPAHLEPRYDGSVNLLPAPHLEKVYASTEVVSRQNPAFIGLEITTLIPLSVTLEVSRIEDDSRVLLVDHLPVNSQGPAGATDSLIKPGIHEHLQIWVPQGSFLSDGSAGDFVYLEKFVAGQGRVQGQIRPSESDTLSDAYLIFDLADGVLTGVVDANSGVPLEHRPGDIFQTQITYLDGDQIASVETGTILIFDENGDLSLEERPLPDGRYQLNYRSLFLNSGDSDPGSQFTVENANLVPGQQTYINPLYGYQFRLPEKWPGPIHKNGLVLGQDPDSSLTLSIVSEPGLWGTISSDFRAQVLEAYGDIQILYEEAVAVGEINTSWTAYGYESEVGQHTGVFLAIVSGSWGHVIDLEGLSFDEEHLLDTARIIVDSLVIRPINRDEHPGNWVDAEIDGYVLSTGTSFLYNHANADWHKFVAKDGYSFIALRGINESAGSTGDLLSLWTSKITGGAPDLAVSEAYQVVLGETTWMRNDYSYSDPDGEPLWGFIMIPLDPMLTLVAWAESTPDNFESMERDTFFPMLVDIQASG
ncbi:MAG: hypothetical protein WA996_00020 [Candidatus Promineifilaceae bacterium]